MVESGVGDNDNGETIDWRQQYDNGPDDMDMFGLPFNTDFSNSSPDSLTFSIGEMEQLLMADDNPVGDFPVEPPTGEITDDFFADLLLDSPIGEPDGGNNSNQSSSDQSDRLIDVIDLVDGPKNSDSPSSSEEKERDVVDVVSEKEVDGKSDESGGGGDDPISKKHRRQLRNRDAAVRSRERKKMYVRDLEMKSKYFEGECRRLGTLLQWCSAENQALRLALQNAKVVDASRSKQESAVLFLESLLLGSLLWFLGISCLLTLPQLVLLSLGKVVVGSVEEEKKQVSRAPKEARSRTMTGRHRLFRSFMVGKTCKASRSRMKPSSVFSEVLVGLGGDLSFLF